MVSGTTLLTNAQYHDEQKPDKYLLNFSSSSGILLTVTVMAMLGSRPQIYNGAHSTVSGSQQSIRFPHLNS